VQTGKPLFDLAPPRSDVTVAVWTADARHAVVGTTRGGQANVYDVEARRNTSSTSSSGGASTTALAFLPDNQRLLFANSLGVVRLYQPIGGFNDQDFPADPARRAVYSVGVSGDGRLGIFGCADGLVQIYDLGTLREVRRLTGHKEDVLGVALSRDGRLALTASADKTVRVWDTTSGKTLRQFRGHDGKVTSVILSADGRRALTGSADKTVRLWDVTAGREIRQFTGHSDAVTSVALSPDGRQALSASADHTVRLWSMVSP
jgi:WD40 repeat protein